MRVVDRAAGRLQDGLTGRGVPGTGPGTPRVQIAATLGQPAELDRPRRGLDTRRAAMARERCREYLRKGESFAFNATNLLRQTRGNWINLFADYSARIELVYVEPPLTTILRQNKNRSRQVPEKVIRELAAKVEPPTCLLYTSPSPRD